MAGGDTRSETERVRAIYDRLSASSRHDPGDGGWPAGGTARWLCSHARGETLEIGVGRGRTLPFYPHDVRLTAVELSPVALAAARRRAAELGLHATFVEGDAQALPFADASFDSVLVSFVLCTVPDDRRAVAEAVRVLRPGGTLALVEHVRSPNLAVRAIEHVLEPVFVWRLRDHLLREPLETVRAAGLEVRQLERHGFGLVERLAAVKSAAAPGTGVAASTSRQDSQLGTDS